MTEPALRQVAAGRQRTHRLDADVVEVRHAVIHVAPRVWHHRGIHPREAVVQLRVPDRVRPPLAVPAVPLQGTDAATPVIPITATTVRSHFRQLSVSDLVLSSMS